MRSRASPWSSPWWAMTGVYEDLLPEGEIASTTPSRQVVAAIGRGPLRAAVAGLGHCVPAQQPT